MKSPKECLEHVMLKPHVAHLLLSKYPGKVVMIRGKMGRVYLSIYLSICLAIHSIFVSYSSMA